VPTHVTAPASSEATSHGDATTTSSATADPRAGALAEMRLVPAAWRVFSASLFEDHSETLPDLETWKTEAYRRLVVAPADYTHIVRALTGSTDQAPYLMALLTVAEEVERDTPARSIIGAAVEELIAGGVLHQCTRRIISAQVALTAHGKAWYASPGAAELVDRLHAYATGAASAHGAAMCTVDGVDEAAATSAREHGGRTRATGSTALYHLLKFNRMAGEATADAGASGATPVATGDAAVAAPTPDPPPMTPDEIDSAATSLKTHITEVARAAPPAAAGAATTTSQVAPEVFSGLQQEIRDARREVREAVFADAVFMRSLNDLGSQFQAAELVRSLDPVEALYSAIANPYSAERRVPAPAAGATGDASGGGGAATSIRPSIELIREFMLGHPGPEGMPMRMRVLSHSGLAYRLSLLGEPEREEVMRLAARGTSEITAIDELQHAVRTRSAAGAARGLMRAGGEDRRGVGMLMSDPGFVTAINEWMFTRPVTVDGAEVIPRDLFFTMCGLSPSAAEDAGSRAVTGEASFTVGPDGNPVMGDRRELQPAEREVVNTLYRETVEELRGLIHRGWFAGTDDSDLLDTLRRFQRAAAAEPVLGYLRAAGENAGPELARRYNETASQDLRTALHQDVDDDTRRTCEEILGMTLNATGVGTVGGAVVLASDGPVGAHITIDQALRETMAGTVTLDQAFDDAAAELHSELHGYLFNASVGAVLGIWRPLEALVTPKLGELARLTGRERVEPIELLANSYRPTGGDLYQALRNGFANDADLAELEGGMPVSEVSRRQRAAAATAAGDVGAAPPVDPFAAPAQALFDQLAVLAYSTQRSDYVAARAALDAAQVPGFTGGSSSAVCTPDRPDGVPAPIGTFDQYYREHFGTDPMLHLKRVLRALEYNQEECVAGAGLAMSDVTGEITSTVATSELEIQPDDVVTPGFTPGEGLRIAQEIWRILHEGGEIHLITTVLLGSRTAGERRLINAQFRTLSGGLDPLFYLETALSVRSGSGGVEASVYNDMSGVGAEGTAAGTAVSDHGDIHIDGDIGALESAADVATTGHIDRHTQLRAAAIQGNVNDLFRTVETLDDDECRQILIDPPLMAQLQAACDGVAWDRIERVLTRRDDLTDRLYSRTTGDRASGVEGIFGGTDETGMADDIRAYIRRMRVQFQGEVAAETTPVRSAEGQTMEVERRLRLACAQLLANPEVEGILRTEMESTDLTAAEGVLVAHGEDSHEAALVGGGNAEAVLAELRQLTAPQRIAHRTDPEYLLELQRRLSDTASFTQAMNILMSDTPVAAGEDHLQRLRTEWDDSEILATLAQLTEAEMRTLQGDAPLMTQILGRLSGASLASARTILNFEFGAASDIVHIEIADPDATSTEPNTLPRAEVERLAYLKQRAITEIQVSSGEGFQQLMEASVRVFRMELRPRGLGDPASRHQRLADDAAGVHTDDPGTDAETRLRGEVWTAVTDTVRDSRAVNDGIVSLNSVQRCASVEDAVKKRIDPSADLLLALTSAQTDNNDGIAAMLRNCSDEKLIQDWATVKHHAPGADAETSLDRKYQRYRTAVDAAGPSPDPAQTDEINALKLAVQRHVLDVSTQFESDLLHEAGGMMEDRALTGGGAPSLTSARDNHQYTEWVAIIRERLPQVDKAKIGLAIGATDRAADMELIQGSTSIALSGAAYRTEDYLHARGTTAGGIGADAEGAELDRYMADYGSHLGEAQVNGGEADYGTISEAEGADLAGRGAEVDRSLAAFRAARAQSAQIAGLIVATVIAATISVLTMGMATGPCAAMLLAAVTAGAASAGSVAVTESIRGQDYSASDEGLKTIGQSVVTGLITGGTMFWAGQIMAGATSSAASGLAGQAAGVEAAAATLPRTWSSVLATAGREATEEMIGETMSNSIEAGLTFLDPRLWRDGFMEGVDRMGATARHELDTRWSAPLRAGLTSFLTSAIPGALGRGGAGDAAEETLRGVDVARNLANLRDQLPSSAFEAFTSWLTTKALDGGFDISRAPEELFTEFMQEIQEGAYDHVGGVMHHGRGGVHATPEADGSSTSATTTETHAETDAVVPPVVVPPITEIRADDARESESEESTPPAVDLLVPPVALTETDETETDETDETATETHVLPPARSGLSIVHSDGAMSETARRHQLLEYVDGAMRAWEPSERVAFLNFTYSSGGMSAMSLADGTSVVRASEARQLAEAWHLQWLDQVTTPTSTVDPYSMALSSEARAALGDGGLEGHDERPLGDARAAATATEFATDSEGRSVSDLLTLWATTPPTGIDDRTPPSIRREYAIYRTTGGTDTATAWLSHRSAEVDAQLVTVAAGLEVEEINTLRTTFPRHLSMVPEGGPISASQLRALFDEFTRSADFSSGGNSMSGFEAWIDSVNGGDIAASPEVGLIISPYDLGGFPTFGQHDYNMNYLANPTEVAHMSPSVYAREIGILQNGALWPRGSALLAHYIEQFGAEAGRVVWVEWVNQNGGFKTLTHASVIFDGPAMRAKVLYLGEHAMHGLSEAVVAQFDAHHPEFVNRALVSIPLIAGQPISQSLAAFMRQHLVDEFGLSPTAASQLTLDDLLAVFNPSPMSDLMGETGPTEIPGATHSHEMVDDAAAPVDESTLAPPVEGAETPPPPADDTDRGTAAAIGGFNATARAEGTPDLSAETVNAFLTHRLDLVLPAGATRTGGRTINLAGPNGTMVPIEIQVDEPASDGSPAWFGPNPNGTGFIVHLSRRAADMHIVRALAHEVHEIQFLITNDSAPAGDHREQPTEMTAHFAGRMAELRVLLAELDRSTSVAGNPGDTARVRTDINQLLATIGVDATTPEGMHRLEGMIEPTDRELAQRTRMQLDGLVDRPVTAGVRPGTDTTESDARYGTARDERLTSLGNLAGARDTAALVTAEALALDGAFRLEESRRILEGGASELRRIAEGIGDIVDVFNDAESTAAHRSAQTRHVIEGLRGHVPDGILDRLHGAVDSPSSGLAEHYLQELVAFSREVTAALGRIRTAINNAGLSTDERRAAINAVLDDLDGRLPAGILTNMRARTTQMQTSTAYHQALSLEMATGRLSGLPEGLPGGAGGEMTVPGLLQLVDQANQAAEANGLSIQYVVIIHNPEGAVGAEIASVEILARPSPNYRTPMAEGGGAGAVGGTPGLGDTTLDVGVGRGNYAAELLAGEDGMVVQSEHLGLAETAMDSRRAPGVMDAAPLQIDGAVVVFADLLQHPQLMGSTAHIHRVVVNNCSAHYDGDAYTRMAAAMSAVLVDGGVLDIQWDPSPENAAGDSRGHITGPDVFAALEVAGLRVVSAVSATPVPYDYTLNTSRGVDANLGAMTEFVPPVPQGRMIITVGARTAAGTTVAPAAESEGGETGSEGDESVARKRSSDDGGPSTHGEARAMAESGLTGPGEALPYQREIQQAFGDHDVAGVEAHVGGAATQAADELGAEAFAAGDRLGFRGAPDLHTAAHEAAHVVQHRGGVQLRGGLGSDDATHEAHADAVADRVVAGESAEHLLDRAASSTGEHDAGHDGALRLKQAKPRDLTEADLETMATATGEDPTTLLDPDQVASAIRQNNKKWTGEHREQILTYLRAVAGGDVDFADADVMQVAKLQLGSGIPAKNVHGVIGDTTIAVMLNAGLALDTPDKKVKKKDVHLEFYPGELESIQEWEQARDAAADPDDQYGSIHAAGSAPQGVGKLYVRHHGNIVAVLDVRGGPPVKLTAGPGHTASPSSSKNSRKGKDDKLNAGKPHRSNVWDMSQIKWGAEIRERSDGEIEFKDPDASKWKTATGERHQLAKQMDKSAFWVVPDATDFASSGGYVTEWLRNDFGPMSWGISGTQMFIHTTPGDEADEVEGNEPDLTCSHACLHVVPSQRDAMIKAGYFQQGVKINIKKYSAHLLPQNMREEMVK